MDLIQLTMHDFIEGQIEGRAVNVKNQNANNARTRFSHDAPDFDEAQILFCEGRVKNQYAISKALGDF